MLDDWIGWLEHQPTVLLVSALAVIMVLDALPLLGVLVPGDVAVLAAVGATGPVGIGLVFVGAVLGCLAGWSLIYLAGRKSGERIRAGRVGRWVGAERWAKAEGSLHGAGGHVLVIAPFLPVLNAVLPLIAGALRVPYRRFIRRMALGAVLWVGMYVALGTVAKKLADLLPGQWAPMVATIVIGFALGWLVLFGAKHRPHLPHLHHTVSTPDDDVDAGPDTEPAAAPASDTTPTAVPAHRCAVGEPAD